MRKEFEYVKGTDKEKYFQKAAKLADSMQNGVALEDGRNLKEELSEEEVKEFMNYLMGLLMPEIDKAVRHYSFLDYHQAQDMKQILSLRIYREFYQFDNCNYVSDEKLKYRISTYIGKKSCQAMRDFLILDRNLPLNAVRNLRYVVNAIVMISAEQQMNPDLVTADMVYEKVKGKSISYKMVVSLMEIYHGTASVDEMLDSDDRLKDKSQDIEACVKYEIDQKTKETLNNVFGTLSKLELYILIKECGCLGEQARKMTAKELSYQDFFVEMAREDKGGDKNIDFGNVEIIRPGRNSGRENVILVESVWFVKEKFYSNKVAKIKRKLSSLQKKIVVDDVKGCLETYCITLWKERYL